MKSFYQLLCEVEEPKKAAIYGTGSYNPVHKSHIQMFFAARDFIEKKGYKVVVGYICPESSAYLKNKMAAKGDIPLSDEDRNNMIRLAIQGTFLQLCTVKQEGGYTSSWVSERHPDAEIVYIRGDDYGPCPNEPPPCIYDTGKRKELVLSRAMLDDVSSTRIRQQIKQGIKPPDLHPAVYQYIVSHKLLGASDGLQQ